MTVNCRGNKDKCYYCGQVEKCTKDHFIPRSLGGQLMVYACALCQCTKRDLRPRSWLFYIESHVAISEHGKKRIRVAVESLIEYMEKQRQKRYDSAEQGIKQHEDKYRWH